MALFKLLIHANENRKLNILYSLFDANDVVCTDDGFEFFIMVDPNIICINFSNNKIEYITKDSSTKFTDFEKLLNYLNISDTKKLKSAYELV